VTVSKTDAGFARVEWKQVKAAQRLLGHRGQMVAGSTVWSTSLVLRCASPDLRPLLQAALADMVLRLWRLTHLRTELRSTRNPMPLFRTSGGNPRRNAERANGDAANQQPPRFTRSEPSDSPRGSTNGDDV